MERPLTTNTRVPKAVREAVLKTGEEAVVLGSWVAGSLNDLVWRPMVTVRVEGALAEASASDAVPGLCRGDASDNGVVSSMLRTCV